MKASHSLTVQLHAITTRTASRPRRLKCVCQAQPFSAFAPARQQQQVPSPIPNISSNNNVPDPSDLPSNESGSSTSGSHASSILQAAIATVVGVGLIGLGGVGYLAWYKWDVLRKIAIAFEGLCLPIAFE